MFENISWENLNHLQVGRFAEYLVRMSFAVYGFEVYSPEVDDHGVDLIVREANGPFLEVQVKSVRGLQYVFFPKSKFQKRENLLGAVVLFPKAQDSKQNEPKLFLIPSLEWGEEDALFCERDYGSPGQKSKPEYGMNISEKNMGLLEKYEFKSMIGRYSRFSALLQEG